MRRAAPLVILALGLCAAVGPAMAQMMPMTPPMNTATYSGDFNTAPPMPSPQQRYNLRLLDLHNKIVRMTKADGGQLTDAHRADLQNELDALNRRFGIKTAGG